jgi:hypothetical protein
MYDAERFAGFARRLVRRMQPVQHASHDRRDHRRRNALTPRRREAEQPGERFALDELHDHKQLARHRDDVECRNHVWMSNARSDRRWRCFC